MAAIEEILAKSNTGKYVLRLYITGHTTRSARAIANIRKTSERFLKDRYGLTVIGLFDDPEKARYTYAR
jgi:circadian clock protein KaiB